MNIQIKESQGPNEISNSLQDYNSSIGHHRNKECFSFCVLEDGRDIGGANVQVLWDWVFIDQMFIKTQRKGVGTMLVNEIENWARARGKKGLYCTTAEFQAPAFYLSLGFEESGRIPEMSNGKDEILFIKKCK